jgi:hypothetical protein
MRRRPMARTDRLLFLQTLDQANAFANACEEGELHASSLRKRCEELLIAIDGLRSELAYSRD